MQRRDTRPWKIHGEGPHSVKSGSFQGNSVSSLGRKDIRFTRNKAGNVVYALVLGWPTEAIEVQSLGTSAATQPGKVAKVELLGTGDNVNWKQNANGLRVEIPKQYQPKVDYAAALKVTLA